MQTLEASYMFEMCTATCPCDSMSCHCHPNRAHGCILVAPKYLTDTNMFRELETEPFDVMYIITGSTASMSITYPRKTAHLKAEATALTSAWPARFASTANGS